MPESHSHMCIHRTSTCTHYHPVFTATVHMLIQIQHQYENNFSLNCRCKPTGSIMNLHTCIYPQLHKLSLLYLIQLFTLLCKKNPPCIIHMLIQIQHQYENNFSLNCRCKPTGSIMNLHACIYPQLHKLSLLYLIQLFTLCCKKNPCIIYRPGIDTEVATVFTVNG
ncbi:hypothetical protein GBAR_LOCUS12222 [Geodia barretti]|uniref:Uncharacterized protein n=1 Tax=Geodia barretti TaxID=519541 RepID=A0AA35S1P3_GEOBA|nr:hypothetical protein GBAR_LOCUS12222 [Geodia barretti]